jgi:hypothetical protein
MEEAHEYGKESSHSVHANGMNEWMNELINFILIIMTVSSGNKTT